MVFNATFNNISAISWRSILLVEETGVPGENRRLVARQWRTLSHYAVLTTPELTTLVGIGTDSIGSCKFIYHTITTPATLPFVLINFEVDTFNTHILDRSMSWLRAGTSIKSGGVVLVWCAHYSFSEMVQSCKCCQYKWVKCKPSQIIGRTALL
jgi:hypothetical protein